MVRSKAALTKAWMGLVERVLRGELVRVDAGGGETLADAAEEARIGAAKAIDGLLGVADHVELAGRGHGFAPVALGRIGGGEQEEDLGLQAVRCPGTRRRKCAGRPAGERLARHRAAGDRGRRAAGP